MTTRLKSKDMDRPSEKYIRNRDLHHFNKSEYSYERGVILTKYYGTLKKAGSKGVPVYNQSGKLTHKPSLKANPKRTGGGGRMAQGMIEVSAPMDRKFDGKRYRLEDVYPTKKRALGMKRMLRADGYSIRVIHNPKKTYPYAVYKRRVRAF